MDELQLKLLPEEHLILREIRREKLIGRSLIVAVSGGVDSVLCYKILKRLQPITCCPVAVVHIHHGPGTLQQKKYRDKTQRFVGGMCAEDKTPVFTNKWSGPRRRLKNESDLREFRYQNIQKILSRQRAGAWADPILVLAHHRDDLIETQFMRLLRGTGPNGLEGMRIFSENKFRPMLSLERRQISALAKKLKLKWCEDPSNAAAEPLRNWLRHQILPKIEKKMPGSLQALSRSLALMSAENSVANQRFNLIRKNGIYKPDFLALSRDAQARVLIQYFKKKNIWQYSRSHIEEIIRRLDNGREEFTFSLLLHTWRVNAEQINAVKK